MTAESTRSIHATGKHGEGPDEQGLDRDIDALLDDLAINRAPEIKAPSDGASRRQKVINAGLVQFSPPVLLRRGV